MNPKPEYFEPPVWLAPAGMWHLPHRTAEAPSRAPAGRFGCRLFGSEDFGLQDSDF